MLWHRHPIETNSRICLFNLFWASYRHTTPLFDSDFFIDPKPYSGLESQPIFSSIALSEYLLKGIDILSIIEAMMRKMTSMADSPAVRKHTVRTKKPSSNGCCDRDQEPHHNPGEFNRQELLPKMAAQVESQSNHPIAQSIRQAYGQTVDEESVQDYEEISGHGIRSRVNGRSVLAGNDRLLHRENIPHDV